MRCGALRRGAAQCALAQMPQAARGQLSYVRLAAPPGRVAEGIMRGVRTLLSRVGGGLVAFLSVVAGASGQRAEAALDGL